MRLVGGSYQWEGRVEIFFNRSWGTITDSDWTSEDTQAVCRTMGYFRSGEIYCNIKKAVHLNQLYYKRNYKTSLLLLVQGCTVKSCSNLIHYSIPAFTTKCGLAYIFQNLPFLYISLLKQAEMGYINSTTLFCETKSVRQIYL